MNYDILIRVNFSCCSSNGIHVIGPTIKFLMRLTMNCEDNLITIPKIISITNNLLANYQIREVAIIALRTLSFELFLLLPSDSMDASIGGQANMVNTMTKTTFNTMKQYGTSKHSSPNHLEEVFGGASGTSNRSANSNPLMSNSEIDTQKEVVLQFLEKFIETVDCQRVLNLLLLIEHLQQRHIIGHVQKLVKESDYLKSPATNVAIDDNKQTIIHSIYPCIPNADQVCEMMLRQSLQTNNLIIHDWNGFNLAEALFRNNVQRILGSSKMFLIILEYLTNAVSFIEIFY